MEVVFVLNVSAQESSGVFKKWLEMASGSLISGWPLDENLL
jgi:hypothetical protein